jgi:hypothetical protein
MNKTKLALIATFASCSVFSQDVIGTAGGSYSTTAGNIDFTVGEVVINTGTNGTEDLTQGFHQPSWTYAGVYDFVDEYNAVVFPNPTVDVVNIKAADFAGVTFTLQDAAGRIVYLGNLTDVTTSVDFSVYASGTYSITLSKEGENLKTFKLIKLY